MSNFYDVSREEVLGELKTNGYTGLSRKEAAKRLRTGKNNIYPAPHGKFREYLIHMLTDYTSVLLMIASLVCLAFRRDTASAVIAITITVSYAFCALVYLRAEKVLENMGAFALPSV